MNDLRIPLRTGWATPVAIVIICGVVPNAPCIIIDSTDYGVWGSWAETWGTPTTVLGSSSDTFSSTRTDGQPLSASVWSNPHQWNFGSASLDSFNLSMTAESAPWMPGWLGSPGTGISINATATTLFHVVGTKLALDLSAYSHFNYFASEQDMQLTLQDITASTTLLNLAHLDEPSLQHISGTYAIEVDPSHEFGLAISGWIGAFDTKSAEMSLQVQLREAVPDSGVTWLLLAGSLSALFWAEKRLRFQPVFETCAR
jgi:hypothetical protein